MGQSLGRWAVIDIETTGVSPVDDSIIDLGYLQFDGTKLVKKYSSLVRYEGELSQFIQKLTGIKTAQVHKAPAWKKVEVDLLELDGHQLLAHNSDFEKSFLARFFEAGRYSTEGEPESYHDSLLFLATLFPHYTSLGLESFIVNWGLADKELHRGFEDSLDLLKVLLLACKIVKSQEDWYTTLIHRYQEHNCEDLWYFKLLSAQESDWNEIAGQIDFDLDQAFNLFLSRQEEQDIATESKEVSLEFSGENVRSIFRDEEHIQSFAENYHHRRSQEDMALKVGQSLKNGVHALIQAPTGTGKTLGYLIPSMLYAKSQAEPVLIATGTKTLQEQAYKKDIPMALSILGLKDQLKVVKVVGSSNHLCELLFREWQGEQDLFSTDTSFEDRMGRLLLSLCFDYNARLEAESDKAITRDSLSFVLKSKLPSLKEGQEVSSVDFKACTGFRCPFKDTCSYYTTLQKAKEADVILGNHSLMFSWPRSFPRPSRIVVDEAHKIEGEASSAFSLTVNEPQLQQLQKTLLHQNGLGALFYLLELKESEDHQEVIQTLKKNTLDASEILQEHLLLLPEKIQLYFKKRPRYTEIYWNEARMPRKSEAQEETAVAIFNHVESLFFILEGLYAALLPYYDRWDQSQLNGENEVTAYTRFEAFFSQIEDVVACLKCLLGDDGGYTRALKYSEKYGFSLECGPIDVGRKVYENLLLPSESVVFTSATLGNAEGDMGTKGIEWATGYSYLPAEKRFKEGFYLPAVFDYKEKTKVYLCDDTPSMHKPDFVESIMEPLGELIEDLGGRTLLLFSSRMRFEIAREILLKKFEGKLPVFVQGMGANVVEDFKSSPKGVLLGMESFGEGIDIPGDDLQFLFVDKIPDVRMDLVIQDRRDFYSKTFGNEFTDYFLSTRTRSLHQKLGRLLRTQKDFGGAIIVDSRIRNWKSHTKQSFFKLMEPYQMQPKKLNEACQEIRDFL